MEIFQIMEHVSICINPEYFSQIMECISVHINSKYFVHILFFSHLHTSIYVQHDDLKYTSYNSHHIHYVVGGKLPFFFFTIFITHMYIVFFLESLSNPSSLLTGITSSTFSISSSSSKCKPFGVTHGEQ